MFCVPVLLIFYQYARKRVVSEEMSIIVLMRWYSYLGINDRCWAIFLLLQPSYAIMINKEHLLTRNLNAVSPNLSIDIYRSLIRVLSSTFNVSERCEQPLHFKSSLLLRQVHLNSSLLLRQVHTSRNPVHHITTAQIRKNQVTVIHI
jgi:hypothetical protein